MNKITLRGFYERETREAFPICTFEGTTEDHFDRLLQNVRDVTAFACDALRCDGLWLTRYEDGVVPVHTAEFVPGRPTVYWNDYECC